MPTPEELDRIARQLRTAPQSRSGIEQVYDRPSPIERLRAGPGPQSVPQRVAIDQPPAVTNPVTGRGNDRIAQRLANIVGEPYRDPRSFFNRPINPQPAIDAARRVGGGIADLARRAIPSAATLDKVSRAGGKVVPAIGAVTEGVNATRDAMTPGMTGIDQTARAAEGISRFAGGAAGMAGGAALGGMTGPLAPAAVPLLSIAGGIAGAAAPDLANAAYNRVFGQNNQLASDKAGQLQAAQSPPAPSAVAAAQTPPRPQFTPPQAAPVAAPVPQPAAGIAAPRVSRQAAPPAPAARPTVPATVQPPAGIAPAATPNPTDGVMFTTLGPVTDTAPIAGPRGAAMAQMEDGRRIQGPEAQNIISGMDRYFEQNPGNTPVEVIRGATRTTATPELGYAEMDTAGNAALQANGGIGQFTKALAQGQVDSAAPEQAKQARELAVQDLQNRGSATNAGISAGPGYAGVSQRAAEAAARLEFDRDKEANPVVIGGGQEPVYDPSGMYVGMRQVPSRLYDQKRQRFIEQPKDEASADKTPQGMKRVGTSGGKPVYEDKNGKRFIGG